MTLPSVEHLFWLRHDPERFEWARNALISDYIKSLPEDRRHAAYAMQCKIDVARMKLSPEEFLVWMQREAVELGDNLADQFSFIKHKIEDLNASVKELGSGG
jgi:hypothetical protein